MALPYKNLQERSPKIKTPDIYYSRSHMECYKFYLQFKDYFAIAKTIVLN